MGAWVKDHWFPQTGGDRDYFLQPQHFFAGAFLAAAAGFFAGAAAFFAGAFFVAIALISCVGACPDAEALATGYGRRPMTQASNQPRRFAPWIRFAAMRRETFVAQYIRSCETVNGQTHPFEPLARERRRAVQ
jgi:hypothetical protein